MATIKVTSTTGVDLSAYAAPDTVLGIETVHTATKWHVNYPGGASDDFTGTKLTFDPVTFDLLTGTITGFTHVESATEKFVVTGVSVDVPADFVGETGQDFLKAALKGNDTITGGNGGDTLLGFDGNDTIDGGKGDDTLVGGKGDDTYILDSTNDIVTENNNEGTDTIKTSVLIADATNFANVENFTYTGKGNWQFVASTLNNVVIGGTGNDELSGGDGNDTLDGGKGNDKFDGGKGDDTFVIDNIAELSNTKISDSAGTDTLVSSVLFTNAQLTTNGLTFIENFTYTGKSNFELSFAGDDTVHTLTGGAGLDKLTGGFGDDTLVGNAGNDILDGGDGGADKMIGGAGNDTYMVDNAGDTVEEGAKGGIDTIKTTINLNLSAGAFVGQEIENVILQGAALIVTGNDLNNVLDGTAAGGDAVLAGGKGNDTLLGGGFDDVLDGGTGNDTMTGGNGDDVYVVDSAGDKVIEKGAGADTDEIDSSITFSLAKFASIENLALFGTADVNATGNTLDNEITGNDGNNILDGGLGADKLKGGLGNDTYLMDADDTVEEASGAGTDTIKTAVPITDALDNIENYIFTGKGDWTFKGNDLGNQITAGAGNDILTGGGGGDVLTGGAGNDILTGGESGDVLDGGKGNDTYVFNVGDGNDALFPGTYNTGDVIKLEGADFYDINFAWDGDTLRLGPAIDGNYDYADTGSLLLWDFFGGKGSITVNIDTKEYNELYGTDADVSTFTFQQGLTGTLNATSAEVIIGGDGNDKINGKGGFYDSLFGGDGDDVITGGGGGQDWIRAGFGNDTLVGLAGDDTLRGGQGFDTVDGGEGNDTADFRDQPFAGAWADLTINRAINDGYNTGDVLIGIENLSGNNNDDVLTGSGNANDLRGRGGNDTLMGGGGDDNLQGNDGSDTFRFNAFGEGSDNIVDFDIADDSLAFDAALDTNKNGILDELKAKATVSDVGGDVTVTFTGGGQIVLQGIGNGTINTVDKLNAAIDITTFTSAHVIAGDGGEDVIGTDGDDVLVGGKGNDFINGGLGNDAINGGGGNDTFVFDISEGDDVILAGTTNTGDIIQIGSVGSDFYDVNYDWDGTNLRVGAASDSDYDFSKDGSITLQNFLNGGKGSINVQVDVKDGNDFYGTDLTVSTITFQQGLTGTNNVGTTEVIIGGDGNDVIKGNGGFRDEIRGGWGDDKVTAGAGNDQVFGNSGNDTLVAGAGDDTLRGAQGFDSIDGGAGKDRADYRDSTSGVWVDLGFGRAFNDGFIADSFGFVGTGDTLIGIEDLRGSDHDDVLVGDANANKLVGRDGDDVLVGRGGDDTLEGDDGDDTFWIGSFAEGKDTITDFDKTDDTLVFAAALDTNKNGIADELAGAVVVDGGAGKDVTMTFAGGGSVVFTGLGTGALNSFAALDAAINITTMQGIDQTGDKNANTLTGTDGWDVLVGLAGNDTIEGGLGNDFLDGGAGNDTFVFNVGDGFDTLAPGTYNTGDLINLAGNDFYDLNFTWDSNRNLTIAQAIDDDYDFDDTGGVVLQNFAGTGGKASITVHIDVADNTLYGTDTSISTIVFQQGLTGTKNATTTEVLIGHDGKDTINGNGGYYDMLFGDGGDDIINGGSGRDVIWGQWQDDVLNGFGGDDRIRGGDGSDIINGGDGIDTAEYNDSEFGVTVDLANGLTSDDGFGFGSQDKLIGIENVRGSDHDDVIIGDGGANGLEGRGGNDTLTGASGADTFKFNSFGEGDDTITDFDKSSDIIAFSKILDVGGSVGIFDELQAAIANIDDQGAGDDVVITFGNGDTLTFAGAGTGTINDITDLVNDPNTQIVGF